MPVLHQILADQNHTGISTRVRKWFQRLTARQVAPVYTILGLLGLLLCTGAYFFPRTPSTPSIAPNIHSVTDNRSIYPNQAMPTYEKLEITFQIANTTATNFYMPYEPSPPTGIDFSYQRHNGISVDALFSLDNFQTVYRQPAFYYEEIQYEMRAGREWRLRTGNFYWKARFSPHQPGEWQYKIIVQDSGGMTESMAHSFTVVASANKGFLRVSQTDSRYFEFDNREIFHGVGIAHHAVGASLADEEQSFQLYQQSGIQLLRIWLSGLPGAAWGDYTGGRNQYRGYLPVTGLVPIFDEVQQQTILTMRIDYEAEGDTGWFDACRLYWWPDTPAVKPDTTYQITVRYKGEGISGPRQSNHPHGLALKLGGWHPDCYEAEAGVAYTPYGAAEGWSTLQGSWFSGESNFLPRLHLGLVNVTEGIVYVESVSVREQLPNGQLGAEVLYESSMEYYTVVDEHAAFQLDQFVELARRYDIYFKFVLFEKDDKPWLKIANDGAYITTGEDNGEGVYGVGRTVNKTRYLQQAYWRYFQARWGYSPTIHSLEFVNEGNPNNINHYAVTDEMGKYFKCSVFGVEVGGGDGQKCTFNHPNHHLVTTSFWAGFPGAEFWGNEKYPNVDYADVHAYISTSWAPLAEKAQMSTDAAHYHLWHSRELAGWQIGKPIIRGEAGMDLPTSQCSNCLGLATDTQGIWYHNFLWANLDSGGLHELYWWTREHLINDQYNHIAIHGPAYQAFISDLPLNNGHYQELNAIISNPQLRVIGQKDLVHSSAHFWIQNRGHTWKNVVDGATITPQSGSVSISGFSPHASYLLQQWDTYTGAVTQTTTIIANSQGQIVIPIFHLSADIAYKIDNDRATDQLTPNRHYTWLRCGPSDNAPAPSQLCR